MKKTITLFLSLVLFAAVAIAHGGEEHLKGTITKVTDKSVTIEDQNKKTTEVALAADTKYMKGDADATLKDFKVGDRVVISAKKSGEKLVATMLMTGATAPAKAAAPHKR